MTIIPGHVLALKLPFVNGAPCFSKRPFLVIEKQGNILNLLNVSSTKGKEKKLLYPSNEPIKEYDPPLDQPSFLKMDELYTIDYFENLHKSIYKRRAPINTLEFERLISEYMKYKHLYEVTNVKYLASKVKQENFL
ncbi:hypothetical protein ABE096_13815 [Robertmurraya massiliosenegalensis]|uniref:hypothetical protein n=1 Tax=Robertmurraya TaxID=2837507 RepID=UPI0039A63411